MICLSCLRAQQAGRLIFALADLDDSGRLSGECEHGHAIRVATPRPNHEWLTTAGAFAFCDGYYREATSSFAAALESSFAFYVEVSLCQAGIDVTAVRELLKQNRQDQRRAGMVSVCYLRDTGKQFPLLQRKWIEFRNDVVHNGHWPTREKALAYMDFVCGAIGDLYQTLGPALESHYEQRLGELALNLRQQEVLMDDFVPFLRFYMRASSIEGAIAEFRKSGPHRIPTSKG